MYFQYIMQMLIINIMIIFWETLQYRLGAKNHKCNVHSVHTVNPTIHGLSNFNISWGFILQLYIDGLVQDCSNSIANALELLQSCTKPSICC